MCSTILRQMEKPLYSTTLFIPQHWLKLLQPELNQSCKLQHNKHAFTQKEENKFLMFVRVSHNDCNNLNENSKVFFLLIEIYAFCNRHQMLTVRLLKSPQIIYTFFALLLLLLLFLFTCCH